MLIRRRKKKEKQGGREEGKGRKERQRQKETSKWMTASHRGACNPSRATVAELERVLQEATAHWHRPGNLTLSVLISTQVSITSRTVSEAPKEFCTSALWPPWIQGRGGALPASSVINVSSSHRSCLENRPKTQREEGYCSQSYFFFLCTGSSYSWGDAFQSWSGDSPQENTPRPTSRRTNTEVSGPSCSGLCHLCWLTPLCVEELSQDQQNQEPLRPVVGPEGPPSWLTDFPSVHVIRATKFYNLSLTITVAIDNWYTAYRCSHGAVSQGFYITLKLNLGTLYNSCNNTVCFLNAFYVPDTVFFIHSTNIFTLLCIEYKALCYTLEMQSWKNGQGPSHYKLCLTMERLCKS